MMAKIKRALGYGLQYSLLIGVHVAMISTMGFKAWLLVSLGAIGCLAVLGALLYLIDWLKR